MSTPPIPPDNAHRPPNPRAVQRPLTLEEADFKNRMLDEYKLLQDKMDKIGSFRFTIKGWSITAVIAATAAGSNSSSLLTVLMISLGLTFMLVLFFYFEFQQVELTRIFGARAGKLEDAFRQIDRGRAKSTAETIAAPYIAHEIVLARHQQRPSERQSSRWVQRAKKRWNGRAEHWRVLKQADIRFYVALILLAFVLPLVPRYHAIQAQLDKAIGKHRQPACEEIRRPI